MSYHSERLTAYCLLQWHQCHHPALGVSAYVSGPDCLTPTTYISRVNPQFIVALNFWTTSPAGPLKATILSMTQQIKSHNRPKATICPQWAM